jgi:LuxR family transcriptional regulator, maltose regulon positive regulatory protein
LNDQEQEMPPTYKAADFPPVSPSKLSPPALPKILARPRLQTLFEQNEDKKLVLIIGQAAQGKTTAAAWYFQNTMKPSVWINLDPGDSDPVNFFYLLVNAVAAQLKEEDTKQLLSLPSQRLGPRECRYHYREWAAALFNTFNRPFHLFLDGLDRLDPRADSFGFLQALVEEMPPGIRLVLTSRGYPPLPFEFQKLKMGRQALVLENEDLAFRPQEIKQYFYSLQGLSLDGEQVKRIHTATEGWVGGIILLAQCLERMPKSSVKEYLAQHLPDRFQREAFQFFSREVFSALPPAEQQVLLRSSLLNQMDPGILKEFFPEEERSDLLKRLARSNLFVRGFPDPQQGMVFSYHQMFRDFLGTLLKTKISEEEWRQLHTKAGTYYENQGDLEKAIHHYLEARAFPEASSLIKQIGLALIQNARQADLTHWLRELPQPLIQADPWLLLFGALPNRFFIALDENLRTLQEAVALFKNQGCQSGLLLGMAFLIEAELVWGKNRPELVREAEELLTLDENESYLYERVFLWRQIGWAHSMRGNPRRGYWACEKAYILANQLADPLLKAGALAHAITCLSILGEFRQAERLLQELNSFSWRFPSAEILFHHSISKVLYLVFHGDLQTALELCTTSLEEAEKQGLHHLYPFFLLHKQVALSYIQEHQQANEINEQLLNLAAALNNDFLKGATTFFAATSAYWSDRRADARDLFDQAMALFAAGDSSSEVYLNGARLARGLLNDPPENRLAAITDLRDVLDYWERFESYLFLTECHLALGLLYHDQGQEEQAREHLQKGLLIARQREYRHFMIISPRDVLRACILAQEYCEAGSSPADYSARLLVSNFGRQAEAELEKLSRHPHLRVSQKAVELRRSVHRAATPLLRIQTFGGLRLHLDRKPMEDGAWDRFQPRQLLVAILSQKNEKTHKEVLIEALWPKEHPVTGEKNFKTTLQRLRKSLEPDLNPVFGSSYIHLHHNQIFMDETLCSIDSRKFIALLKEGKEHERSGDGPKALDCFVRALDLYQGDFIPEERYAPWAEQRREDLKDIYIDLLNRAARYHENAGSFKKAVACLKQVLESDPLLEEACRGLMTLYAGKGLFNEAIRVYETCQKALQSGLDSKPDPVTTALYQGIKERQQKS